MFRLVGFAFNSWYRKVKKKVSCWYSYAIGAANGHNTEWSLFAPHMQRANNENKYKQIITKQKKKLKKTKQKTATHKHTNNDT